MRGFFADRTHDPVQRAPVLPKPRVGSANDPLEAEADRAADRVATGNFAGLLGGTGSSGIQRKEQPSPSPASGARAASAVHALHSGGVPLSAAQRAYFEPRFGQDFSNVRLHNHGRAAAAANDIRARAYTWRNEIAFAPGEFSPGTLEGRRLIAHELAHVVQQDRSGDPLLQRDEQKGQPKDVKVQPVPQTPDPATSYFHVVVRDSGLDLGGGVLVKDLEDAKTKLTARRIATPWTLVLSIHASQDRLGAQSPPDWTKDAKFYADSDVKRLFGDDSAFVNWRDQFGPNQVVLYGCQVTAAFEQTIADNLTRGGHATNVHGLGEGCKPRSTSESFGVQSRAVYDTLSDADKKTVSDKVHAVNRTWGYYGGQPVPDSQELDYLFKGPKPGWWPKVEVIVKQGDTYDSANPPIPYWNRTSNSEFLRQCTRAVGNLREHRPSAPMLRDE